MIANPVLLEAGCCCRRHAYGFNHFEPFRLAGGVVMAVSDGVGGCMKWFCLTLAAFSHKIAFTSSTEIQCFKPNR